MATVVVVQVRKWNAAASGPDPGNRMVALALVPPGYGRVAGSEREIDASLLDDNGFAPEEVQPLPREPIRAPTAPDRRRRR